MHSGTQHLLTKFGQFLYFIFLCKKSNLYTGFGCELVQKVVHTQVGGFFKQQKCHTLQHRLNGFQITNFQLTWKKIKILRYNRGLPPFLLKKSFIFPFIKIEIATQRLLLIYHSPYSNIDSEYESFRSLDLRASFFICMVLMSRLTHF